MIVVNMFGQPSAGKSRGATQIFSELKDRGINAEYVYEFAKKKVWEKSYDVLRDQIYIFAKQNHALFCLKDSGVDVAVVDSPLPLSLVYGAHYDESFKAFVVDTFNSYNNINYFVKRVKPYNPSGRMQTEEQSDQLSEKIRKVLMERNIPFVELDGIKENYSKIADEIVKLFQ